MSCVVSVLHIVSIINRNTAPNIMVIGSCLRWSLPTISLERCGIIRPIQPIVPEMQTVDAVKQLAQIMTIPRKRVVFMPKVFASTSPNESMFNLHASNSNITKHIITTGTTTAKSL